MVSEQEEDGGWLILENEKTKRMNSQLTKELEVTKQMLEVTRNELSEAKEKIEELAQEQALEDLAFSRTCLTTSGSSRRPSFNALSAVSCLLRLCP